MFSLTNITQFLSMIGVGSTMTSLIRQALSATSLVSMARSVLSGDVVAALEKTAETLFPKVAPELRLAAAVVAAYDNDKTKWLQQALNALLGANLDVDGIYGPLTRDAVSKFQEKEMGLKVDGWAYRLTNAAIQLALDAMLGKADAPEQTPKLAPSQIG